MKKMLLVFLFFTFLGVNFCMAEINSLPINPLFFNNADENVEQEEEANDVDEAEIANISKIKMIYYVEQAKQRIISNWTPVKYLRSEKMRENNITAKVTILKNGNLVNSRIVVSHGNKAADEAALAAIKKSAPFPPLPEEFADEAVSISILFRVR